MILPNIFTKKYHRSIMISIEVSLNHHDASKENTKLQSTKYRKTTICLLKIVPKNRPTKRAFNAHSTGNEYPTLGLSMTVTWSLSDRVTGTKRPANVLIFLTTVICFPSYSWLILAYFINQKGRHYQFYKTEIVDIINSIELKYQTFLSFCACISRHKSSKKVFFASNLPEFYDTSVRFMILP